MDGEIISIISDITVGVSAIVVAIIAVIGINTWRKELTGKAKYEISRSIMHLVSKFESDFKSYRHPFSSSNESMGRQRGLNESREEAELLDQWYIKIERIKPLIEDLIKLRELGWEADVVLKEDDAKQVSASIKVFLECYAELSSAIQSYFETRHDEITRGILFNDQDWLKELHHEVYWPKKDVLLEKILGAKEQLSSILKAYIK